MPADVYSAEIERRDSGILVVRRKFDAPRDLVWKAYTSPELQPRWLGGLDGWQMTVCTSDFRVGGTFRWLWRTDDGSMEFGFFGEFLEIDAPNRLVNTESYDPGTMGGDMGTCVISVTFDEAGAVTTMTSTIDYGSDKALDAALETGMTDGMELSYQRLDTLLVSVA